MKLHEEKSLILIKPDAVRRGIIGDCIARFEQREFRLCGMKIVRPSESHMRAHYGKNAEDPEWLKRVGQNTLDAFIQHGIDPQSAIGTSDCIEAGKKGIDWLVEFMISGPMVALVVSGPNAVEMVRKIIGSTMPAKADIGSIRGDYSIDSPVMATLEKRTVQNLIHASGTVEEAEFEVAHWFEKNELCG